MHKLTLSIASVIALFTGSIYYLYYSEIITVHMPARAYYVAQKATKKHVALNRFANNQKQIETIDLVWHNNCAINLNAVTAAWVKHMQEENNIDKHIKIDTVALNASQTEAFISLSHKLVAPNLSIMQKWLILQAFFDTIHPLFPEVTHVRFLIKNEPMADEDIDFSASLPITNFLQSYATNTKNQKKYTRKTIILAPYGDKQKTGRVIAREFERKYTRLLAQGIKNKLENSGYMVHFTHDIGQTSTQEARAAYANILNADLYIALNCYESTAILPEINSYFLLYNPVTDFWHKKNSVLHFTQFDKAYLKQVVASTALCQHFAHYLKTSAGQRFFIQTPYGLPLTQLVGMQTPALLLECGLHNHEQIAEIATIIAKNIENSGDLI